MMRLPETAFFHLSRRHCSEVITILRNQISRVPAHWFVAQALSGIHHKLKSRLCGWLKLRFSQPHSR